MQPAGNPYLFEIDQKHAELSPQAQKALLMSGVPSSAYQSPNFGQPEPTGPPAPRLISGLTPPVRGLGPIAAPPTNIPQPMPGIPTPNSTARGGTIESHLQTPDATNLVKAPRYDDPSTLGFQKQKLTDMTEKGSGINQIKSPWARVPLQIADAVGRAFLPGLEMGIPGTSGHHDVLVHQQDNRVKGMEANATAEASQARDAAAMRKTQAETNDLDNPQPTDPTNAFQLWHQQNPQGTLSDFNTENAKAPVEGKPDLDTMLAAAVADATKRGVHPADDPAVRDILQVKSETGRPAVPKEPNSADKYLNQLTQDNIAKGMSPDEAYKAAFRQNTKEQKTDPGVSRMQVLVNSKGAQVVDPNDPEKVKFMSMPEAIRTGAESPQSIPFKASAGTTTSFTTGPNATVLNNINTAHAHIQQLQGIANALHNGDMVAVNRIANEFANQTGQPAPASFQLLKTAVASEIAKTTHGGVATENESKELGAAINAANSPQSLTGVLNNARTLMESKRANLKSQYEAGKQGKPNFEGAQHGGPAVGTVEDGHRFKGGNPGDPNNWEKVN
jgi:hypothetical protein